MVLVKHGSQPVTGVNTLPTQAVQTHSSSLVLFVVAAHVNVKKRGKVRWLSGKTPTGEKDRLCLSAKPQTVMMLFI